MKPPAITDNHRHLVLELQRLEFLLQAQTEELRRTSRLDPDDFRGLYISDRQADGLLHPPPPASAALLEARRAAAEMRTRTERQAAHAMGLGADLRLPRLAALFGLSEFERDLILLALAPELDARFETLFAYVQNDVAKKRPRVQLGLELWAGNPPEAWLARESLLSNAPLLREGLLRLSAEPPQNDPALPARALRLPERIVDFLIGHDVLEARLADCARILPGTDPKPIAMTPSSVTFLEGPDPARQAAFVQGRGRPVLEIDLRLALPIREMLPLIRREACLREATILFSHFESLLTEPASTLQRFGRVVMDWGEPVFLGSLEYWHPAGDWSGVAWRHVRCDLPNTAERAVLWRESLNGAAAETDIDRLAARYILNESRLRSAAATANLRHTRGEPAEADRAAREQTNPALRKLARSLPTPFSWDDLILPARAQRQLREICASVRQRDEVRQRWQLERFLSSAPGLSILFAGPSGVGKTMAAQVLAHELQLDLYRIDLACVVSKYIGETEKNLSRLFAEAHDSNAILFFDEADALFGKRSEVKEARDLYANIQAAHLLQKMEEHEGVCILATNLSQNMDDAFARRLQHRLDFPVPDAAARLRIWHRIFSPETPLAADVDFDFVSRQFELTGGNIRNVALLAATLAAEAETEIGMDHVMLGIVRELRKIGRMPVRSEFGPYYDRIQL